ncbi:GNAT family N-acetyltransferase [Fictibacillus phosphorivorans]|uniref:GNAT family N-acetyltransferase n=1 Tax=Fictibacillus phosphorivorans TaxID=1221500 RepID=UPI002041B8DA|nr:GNAT family protein [Fictibacillus phosphorivorans]MCM3718072.1 GNAT family N-acetyltransferase [Fictibacillus phosphorivorans]MCM3775699.1 GNAT family N-acetyltransferase [Fictibacillus phosphorivorans]
MNLIKFKKIDSESWRAAMELSVSPEQEKFVASITPPVAIALAKAYIRPDGKNIEPYCVYHSGEMIDFFNLHYTLGSKEDYWLFHFFIGEKFQRRGYGSETINALIQHLKQNHPSCQCLRLTVHPENEAGKKFYLKLGFKEEHILTFGEPTYSISI